MNYQQLLADVLALPENEQRQLIEAIALKSEKQDYLSIRREKFFNKQIGCPHCNGMKYYRYGKDKGSMRFKCKECKRTFTEYTGTWLAGLHKKGLANQYLELMAQNKSLDKVKATLEINKKTAFDWRHKVLSSFENIGKNNFDGIIESDETFFLYSAKGNKSLERKGRKRGENSSKRGISNDQVAVITTVDRKGTIGLTVASMGRIEKKDIDYSIGNRISEGSILCTDGHASYKGFAKDNNLSHVVLRADLKQHVKQGVYHIQNVNSMHNKIKKWIDWNFWGVSTKYLQNYMNWYHVKQVYKQSKCPEKDLAGSSVMDSSTLARYRNINEKYKMLIATQI